MPDPISFRFDGKNPAAQKVAERQAALMVTRVSQETMHAIRALIVRSIHEGIPVYDAARIIQLMVGTNIPQTHAVMNYWKGLIDSGLAMDRVNKLTDRYINKKVNERALNISRTEVITSLNRGELES